MKKILGLAIVALLVMAMIGGGTWAYFSDLETSTGNTLTAGTLNLQVGAADPLTATITVTDAKPGDNTTGVDWLLKNTGNLPGYLDITFSNIVDADNTVIEPEVGSTGEDGTEDGELAERLTLLSYIDEDDNNTFSVGDVQIFNDFVKGGATALLGQQTNNYAMAANYGSGNNKAVRIEWSVNSSVGNCIMGDSTGFDVEFSLEQTAD